MLRMSAKRTRVTRVVLPNTLLLSVFPVDCFTVIPAGAGSGRGTPILEGVGAINIEEIVSEQSELRQSKSGFGAIGFSAIRNNQNRRNSGKPDSGQFGAIVLMTIGGNGMQSN